MSTSATDMSPGEAAAGAGAPEVAPGAVDTGRDAPVRVGDEDFWVEARGDFSPDDAKGYFPTPESLALTVDVRLFEGPLDLLLFLIKKHHVDIFDIPIVLITEKYIEVIEDMRKLNLDVAGEFLVMAATLAHIKSKMLLPPEERPEDEADEDGGDPRLALVRRLLEYQKYKDAARWFGARAEAGAYVFPPGAPAPPVGALPTSSRKETPLIEVGVMELIRLLAGMLEKASKSVSHEITFERISVGARINEMVDFAIERDKFTFGEALSAFGADNAHEKIVTFLSILEMAKMKLLRVHQATPAGTIYVSAKQENLAAADGTLLQTDLDDV